MTIDELLAKDPEIWEGHVDLLSEAILRFHRARWDLFEAFVAEHGSDLGVRDPDPADAILSTVENVIRIGAALFPAEWERSLLRRRQAANPDPAPKKKDVPRRLRTAVFERDGYRCRQCGGWQGLEADHIHPESRGGPTTIDNLQTLCGRCNRQKSATIPSPE